ncbi:ABC transporter permease [Pantoea sp. ARC270]|uniref:ABC transporter permease n=1 Tax=Pantoea sp. ARC270 TaxID=2027923 RepID=UPI000DA85595|nr:ABC transporter permease [Pantoea sp. ARC270]PZL89644.1 ABC transporter permease [Pantoea sp. ARC270]
MIWRWFWREWRSPSLLIVWLALTLAVACVLALGSISDRMEKGLNQQSRDFMAGDRTLRSTDAAPEAWLEKAQQSGLTVSRQLTFMTMTFAGESPQLAAVKAVDDRYPMAGTLQTAPPGLKPQAGTALAAPRLMALLNLKVGDMLDVGDTRLRITGELIQEPDGGFNPFEMAPRLLINLADAAKTGAIQPGSRLTWRYKFLGNPEALARYDRWIEPQLKTDQRWISVDNSEDALGRSMQRAQQFLLLSALLTLMLAIAAVAVAMSHYCRSRYDLVAVLKTLGATQGALQRLIIGQWLAVLLLAAIAGGLVGQGVEAMLMAMLKPVLPASLPAASLWPLKIYIPLMSGVVVALLALLVGGSKMLWALLAGVVVLAALLALLGWGTLLLLRRLVVRNLALRLAINRLLRQPGMTLSQLAAFSFSFMLLALLLVMRGDLLDRWQQQLPADSPNFFLLNMTADQVPQVRDFLQSHQIRPETFYPIARVRLTGLNGKPADPERDNALNRELNLTALAERPDHNPLVAGSWPPGAGEVSMEVELADRLGLKLGDTLTFEGDTQTFSARISSLRKVDWESLKPNFFFIFPPGALDSQPQTWLTSFRMASDPALLAALNRAFPTLSLLDIGSIMRQVGQVLTQVSQALEIMVVLVTACGILLLLAQIQVGMRQRRQELVVYRTLGAGRRLLRTTLWCEFALLGVVSGVAAAIGAEAALWGLQRKIFDFPWQPDWTLWLALPLCGALLLSLCGGWLGIRLLKGKALFRKFDAA